MAQCRLVCQVCVCVRVHSDGSSFPLVVNIRISHICLCFCLSSLITFRLSSENTIFCLRSSFHLRLHLFFFAGRWWLLWHLEWDGSAIRGGGEATNQRKILNMRTRAVAACNIDNNHITSNVANNQLVMNAACFPSESISFLAFEWAAVLFSIENYYRHVKNRA